MTFDEIFSCFIETETARYGLMAKFICIQKKSFTNHKPYADLMKENHLPN